jgi:hypothetical protein
MRAILLSFCVIAIGALPVYADPPEPRIFSGWMTPRWTLPSDTGRLIGYHVGGGALPRFGEPRYGDEGTWGWDYQGILPRRVMLNWWHGRRYQGGAGAYRTEGPHLYRHDEKAR